MKDLRDLESEKQSLLDYVRSCSDKYGSGFAEQLRYVERFLRENVSSVRPMLDDAEELRIISSSTDGQVNIERIVSGLSSAELPRVGEYMHAIEGYIEGKPFDIVYEAFGGLSRLKPIPDTTRIPKDSLFHKGPPGRTLANMREEV
jgi:hypothetical protein